MILIYDYLNYRDFLRDFFAKQKQARTGVSQLSIMKAMGISSKGFLSNVIAGRNNLTPVQTSDLAGFIRLNKHETEYFENLVLFTQAKAIVQKNRYYKRLTGLRRSKRKDITKRQLSLFSQWYYVVIRELLNFVESKKGDYRELGRMVQPSISPEETQKAIATLQELGLIKQNKQGRFVQAEATISAARESRSLDIANFQLTTMDFAKKALERVKRIDRDISTITLTLSTQSLLKAKAEIEKFRAKLAKIAEDEDRPNQVFQCNIQLFPMSKRKGD